MNWHWINWVVLCLYFLGVVYIGVYFSKKNNSSEDYFTASGRIPAWVTACSIYATALSSLSFIAIPASVYKSGWIMGLAPLGIILMVLWSAYVFVPFFRKIKVTTAYEYLEKRFDRSFRLVGSLSFILFHIIRIAVVLYLPTLALIAALPGVNPILLTAIVGFLCVVYTSMGGIEAVVWSDAIQTIVLLAGAFMIIIVGFMSVPDGVNAFEVLQENNKIFHPGTFDFNLAGKTFWGILLGGFLNSIYSYVASQDIVQRYNTTKNIEEAKKSLFLNIPLLCTSIVIFIGMGSALFLYFTFHRELPANIDGNAILPYFVVHDIPLGLSGLVIAAIFAAAQSTVSSSLNSVATCITSDIVKPIMKNLTDKGELKIAKYCSWIVGIVSSLLALRFISVGQGDMFLYFQAITGLLGGPIAGLFLVGIFIKRANAKAAWVGFIISIIVAVYIGNPAGLLSKFFPAYEQPHIFEFLISLVIIGSCVVPSYIASFFTGEPLPKKIEHLTYESTKLLSE
ncbi:MAG: sodium:solute symporter [Cetobacterium sp.]|uniref:sodium:solute symporter n=1 Tax=Cetobacterium sp. TaxID=2071632 RepID=UPI003F329AAC